MHGEHDRDDGKGEDVHGVTQVRPFAFGAAEAQCQYLVEILAPAGGAVTRHGQVRNKRQEQIHGGTKQVGGDGHQVPRKRRMEVRPQLALVRDGKEPISQPHTAHVHEDTETSLHETEGGHQFRSTGERTAEFRFEHAQDRGNERTSMADTDPEHGVDEEDAPVRRPVHTRHTEAIQDHVAPGIEQTISHHSRQKTEHHPEFPGRVVHGFHDHFVHLATRKRIEHQVLFAEVRLTMFLMGVHFGMRFFLLFVISHATLP